MMDLHFRAARIGGWEALFQPLVLFIYIVIILKMTKLVSMDNLGGALCLLVCLGILGPL